jgi:hypothetical protein
VKEKNKMGRKNEMRQRYYDVDLSQKTAIMYFNGIKARNIGGFFWMWRNIFRLGRLARQQPTCLQVKIAVVSPTEMMQVSYWKDQAALRAFYQKPEHVAALRYTFQHPDHFTLYNETYEPPISTRYLNGVNGYATSQPPQARAMPLTMSGTN